MNTYFFDKWILSNTTSSYIRTAVILRTCLFWVILQIMQVKCSKNHGNHKNNVNNNHSNYYHDCFPCSVWQLQNQPWKPKTKHVKSQNSKAVLLSQGLPKDGSSQIITTAFHYYTLHASLKVTIHSDVPKQQPIIRHFKPYKIKKNCSTSQKTNEA